MFTTDIWEVQKDRSKFSWGFVVNIHFIGDYAVIQYTDDENIDCFIPYIINGLGAEPKGMSHHYNSLELALISAFACRSLGNINEARYMTTACAKILGY